MSTQMARISAPLSGSPLDSRIAPARYLRFGTFHLDLQKEEFFNNGKRLKLQGKVYQALLALVEKPGQVVTREELRTRLWPAETHVNYDANVNTTVNKLRQVLGDSGERRGFVDTIPRKGYSFAAEVEYFDAVAPREAPRSRGIFVAKAEAHLAEAKTLLLEMKPSSAWFVARVIFLIVTGMLLGAALVRYASH